jgi:hypothetical protein
MKKLNIIGRFNVLKVPQTTSRLCKDAVLLALFISMLMLPFPEVKAQTGEKKPYSPYVGQDFPQNVYFGDTHLHTAISFDAYGDGNTTLGPDDAYRFAKGEQLTGHDGQPVRISRPLDFLVVADHSEYLGVIQGVAEGNELLTTTEAGARWAKMAEEGKILEVFGEVVNDGMTNQPRELDSRFAQSVWKEVGAAAERHNVPGQFTALIGYEYSSTPEGDNLHRIVIFRDGADKTNQVLPFSSFDSPDPELLWAYMQSYEDKTGGRVLAIPHNGNVSAGKMFALQDFHGKELTRSYAETRARWEPLVETTQIKGDSETHPVLSPEDEFADFETWDKGNLVVTKRTSPEQMRFEYSRSALKLGLAQDKKIGANPFKFGMIGATDAHTSFSNAEEDNYLGKYAVAAPAPDRWSKKFPPLTVPGVLEQFTEWESSQSGYAGVWATENTREAIWDAMMRKEVYATTGPRMTVRFFGGWDYVAEDADRHNLAAIGYNKGVPMGGDLYKAPKGKTPTFLVAAMKDPDGANLDRIQIIKGWLDKEEQLHEKVFDVVWAGNRKIDDEGKLPPVGNNVELETATYSNSIGAPLLSTTWTDPDFDPNERAFYYVRVLEIPTPRWTAFDEVRFGIKMDPEVTRVLQERSYTSPIWYTP